MFGNLTVTFAVIRLSGPRFKPRLEHKFGSTFQFHAHPLNLAAGTKDDIFGGPKPGHEERVGGGMQISPPKKNKKT